MPKLLWFLILGVGISLNLLQTGCKSAYKKSVGAEDETLVTRIFVTDFDTAWQAALEALKSSPLDVSNRESGFIRTKWIENTNERNITDSYGPGKVHLKAQYRFRLVVGKGVYQGSEAVRANVKKEQLIQQDVLEGWRSVPSDNIDENTLMYRIARIIDLKQKVAELEQDKLERAQERVSDPQEP